MVEHKTMIARGLGGALHRPNLEMKDLLASASACTVTNDRRMPNVETASVQSCYLACNCGRISVKKPLSVRILMAAALASSSAVFGSFSPVSACWIA